MIERWFAPRSLVAAAVLAGMAGGSWLAPAQAQDAARIARLEAEIRALQRAVFPGGDSSRFFPPEVTPGRQPLPDPATTGTVPGATALTDVLARLDALEGQVQRLTAQSEEKDHALSLLQKRLDDAQAASAAVDTPGAAASPAATPTPQPTGVIPLPSATTLPARPATTPAAAAPPATPTPAAAAPRATPAAAAPSAARLAAVRAIAKPQTGNTADDEYSYGFRLYNAGFLAEARQQLALYLQKYPKDSKISLGRNLLGRAYLDDAQPREAAKYFFENYQSNKQGARAPDSLLYLADSMIAISDTNRACIALAEFGDTYPALATGRLKEQYDRTKAKVRCPPIGLS